MLTQNLLRFSSKREASIRLAGVAIAGEHVLIRAFDAEKEILGDLKLSTHYVIGEIVD